MSKSICIYPDCTATPRARFLCSRHYAQALKSGNPPPRMSNFGKPAIDRFNEKVERTATCWLWVGGKSTAGYAAFSADGINYGHRWAYVHFIGPIPEGMVLDHLCRVRHCVNPAHLEVVTNEENIARGEAHLNAARAAARLTHCPHGHPKNEKNTYRRYNKKLGRWEVVCRPCRNARLRRRAAEQRALRSVQR